MKRWELESRYAGACREIAELREELAGANAATAELAGEIERLKGLLEEAQRAGKRQATPFRRRVEQRSQAPKRPGRKAKQGVWKHQRQPSEAEKAAAETQTSELPQCPCCDDPLVERRTHERFEWDIPPVVPVLTRFVSESGYCHRCGRRYESRHGAQTSTAHGAAGVAIGPRAKAVASDMKHYLGVSYGKIQGFFNVVFDLPASRSGLFKADMRLAARATPVYRELIELVRQASQVHADETGWRIGALSAWLWVFTSREVTVYTIRTSRGHEVVLEMLGCRFKGYLTSDGLLTYDAAALADFLKQKCLAHILRRLSTLSASQKQAHVALAEATTPMFRDALALARRRAELDPGTYAQAAAAIEQRLDAIVAAYATDADDDGARMARHLAKHRQHLLPFLYVDGLEATNNQAERDLRPGVITRKTGGCNRTQTGAEAHATLASIGATCRKRRIPVLQFLIDIQRSLDHAPSIAAPTPVPP